ncbi:hypothetical protein BZG02_19645 [Labilibaculum filiforme]|uniref:HTH merR-type domain-containing protein n=1 Tax=Labilibaculum filiforme TaxID=1940526 RepID=A0A2N3HQL9_9BACT|nr:MerR family transcriptional regulator [Labilibaculum filiforme]PKQ60356.1 hypothetical protein BZG02_19645 [Labilibaculum filiforme]
MSRYSIKDIEQITGIKAHTIRVWERRYGIIQPERTETNIRLYSDEDLKKLLNISMLNASGIKISHLAKMGDIDLETNILELSKSINIEDISIDKLILATINFDEDLFESILNRCLLAKGMEETTFQILFPFFQRIGTLWQIGTISPAQEHFISNLIRQKLFAAIDSLSGGSKENAKKIIFFLKEDELHEISILFYNYIAKKYGIKTLYLGQNLPFSDLQKVVATYHPDGLFTSFITPISESELNNYIVSLTENFDPIDIVITGFQLKNQIIKKHVKVKIVSSLMDFKEYVTKLE